MREEFGWEIPRLMYEVYGPDKSGFGNTRTTWAARELLVGFEGIDKVIKFDQSPIGRAPCTAAPTA